MVYRKLMIAEVISFDRCQRGRVGSSGMTTSREHSDRPTDAGGCKMGGFEVPLAEQEVPNLVRTMLGAGFNIDQVERKPNLLALHMRRSDEFGNRNRYFLAYAGEAPISPADAEGLRKVGYLLGRAKCGETADCFAVGRYMT
jgi:hypothetical protein